MHTYDFPLLLVLLICHAYVAADHFVSFCTMHGISAYAGLFSVAIIVSYVTVLHPDLEDRVHQYGLVQRSKEPQLASGFIIFVVAFGLSVIGTGVSAFAAWRESTAGVTEHHVGASEHDHDLHELAPHDHDLREPALHNHETEMTTPTHV